MKNPRIARWLPLLGVLVLAGTAVAVAGEFANIPDREPPITNWMTSPATPIAHEVRSNALFISALVAPYLILPQALLLYCIFKFREGNGRKPATFHENVKLEVAWTVIPALTLVIMALPTYKIIKHIETMPAEGERVLIRGHQFFWSYKYLDREVEISDAPLVVPAGTNIICDVTSVDVTHAWWVPSFAVKQDAIPGRLQQLWFNVKDEGWYKGQCAELCGALHSRMLIDVHVVSPKEYEQWIAKKLAEAAVVDAAPAAGEVKK